ncbi:MAG: hypothetical protein PWR08_1014 [Thermoanaerobacterium sp.]|jgi:hypothetical protein|nr:hypothetical protein [Thermoanaerobacterium sp.]MDN5316890.1 hypothetical protein [Thermoanaerobacterium sp.]
MMMKMISTAFFQVQLLKSYYLLMLQGVSEADPHWVFGTINGWLSTQNAAMMNTCMKDTFLKVRNTKLQ